MLNELEVALNAELTRSSTIRTKIYDEMEDINSIIDNYSSYKSAAGTQNNANFKSFVNPSGGNSQNNTDLEVLNLTDLNQKQVDYFGTSLPEDASASPVTVDVRLSNQTDTLKTFIDSKEVLIPEL